MEFLLLGNLFVLKKIALRTNYLCICIPPDICTLTRFSTFPPQTQYFDIWSPMLTCINCPKINSRFFIKKVQRFMLKKWLRHRCFLLNFGKFVRAAVYCFYSGEGCDSDITKLAYSGKATHTVLVALFNSLIDKHLKSNA